MQCRSVVRLTYADPMLAARVAASLRPDDDRILQTSVEGRVVRADVTADSPMGLARAIDDLLACVAVSERTLGILRRGRPERETRDSEPG